ncbi:MAG: DUF1761 domain-containing protein [Candidatus Saccharimonadales bacterium]
MMGVDYLAVLVASVAQFAIGAIWYMPIFGKLWGQIHGFDKLSKKEQKEAQKSMMPWLVVQFVVTVMTSFALAKLFALAPDYSIYKLALIIWLGFFVPVQVGAVIFGGTDPKWMLKKTLIMSGGSFFCLLAAAAIIGNMQ